MKGIRRVLSWIAIALGLLIVAGGIYLAVVVDDWSRDLTTNFAATTEDAEDPSLRPIRSDLPPGELAEVVTSAAETLPAWEFVEKRNSNQRVELSFVRTTAVMKYKDDITVTISADDDGSVLSAESQSRVGRGDLGQNPRNLKELLSAVREKLRGVTP